jgi:two-component system, LytTR family, sensor kinase
MKVDSTPPVRLQPAARAKWLFFFTFLTLFASLDTLHDYVAHRGEGTPISVFTEIQLGLTYWLPYFFLVPAAVILVERYRLNFERARSFVIHGLAGLVFTYVHLLFAAITPLASGPDLPYWGRYFYRLKFEFAIDYLFYCIIVVTAYMLQHYADLKEGEVRASQLETGLAQTHLRAIQAQLNPHFFFNTLQGISVLASAGERDSVVEMLGRLSSLLRVSFDKHRPQKIPLAAEMEFLDSYLAIHQLSFGQRLSIQYDLAPDTLCGCIPAMLLQPLVENAIVHGVAVKPGKGVIRINSRRVADRLIFEVADSGPGFQSVGPYRNGVGLSATESRLQLLYGDEHTIDYCRSEEGGALVVISIPFTVAAAGVSILTQNGIAA